MAWEDVTIRLACGCEGHGTFEDTFPEDEQRCSTHGATTVQRVSRVYENNARSNYQFGKVES